MASTNKTANLELSQFEGSDKPDWLTDYNGDMLKIDTNYGAVAAEAEAATTASQAAAASAAQAALDAASALSGIAGAIEAASAATAAAEQATSVSTSALSTANSALSTASAAAGDATSALSTAQNAKNTAESAQAAAAQAATDAAAAATAAAAAVEFPQRYVSGGTSLEHLTGNATKAYAPGDVVICDNNRAYVAKVAIASGDPVTIAKLASYNVNQNRQYFGFTEPETVTVARENETVRNYMSRVAAAINTATGGMLGNIKAITCGNLTIRNIRNNNCIAFAEDNWHMYYLKFSSSASSCKCYDMTAGSDVSDSLASSAWKLGETFYYYL